MRMSDEQEKLITAMCLWEAVLEMKDNKQEVLSCFENIGTAGMRFYVAQWVRPVDDAWDALSQDEKDASVPFDWEFVPNWIAKHVSWENPHQPMVLS
ncbi:hypothetical protein [Sphingomonas oryzagri]